MEYLKNSTAVREKLAHIFEDCAEGIAIVAFVGANAASYLPKDLSKLRIICWPKAGGTNPDGVRSLLNAGAAVDFCDRLHSKIYYSVDNGVIVGSANLSDNALGENSLHEFAIFDNDAEFDIDDVISRLGHLSAANEANLAKLQLAHDLYWRRNPPQDSLGNQTRTFMSVAAGIQPRRWKIVSYSEKRDNNEQVRKAVKDRFNQDRWENDNDVKRSMFSEGDIVLQVETNSQDFIERSNATWFYVDYVAKRRGGEIIIQKDKSSLELGPFAIDAKFKKAFKQVFNAFAWEDAVDHHGYAQPELISAIKASYAGDA